MVIYQLSTLNLIKQCIQFKGDQSVNMIKKILYMIKISKKISIAMKLLITKIKKVILTNKNVIINVIIINMTNMIYYFENSLVLAWTILLNVKTMVVKVIERFDLTVALFNCWFVNLTICWSIDLFVELYHIICWPVNQIYLSKWSSDNNVHG